MGIFPYLFHCSPDPEMQAWGRLSASNSPRTGYPLPHGPELDHRAASKCLSVPFPPGASGSGAGDQQRCDNGTAKIAKHAQIGARWVVIALRLGLRTRAISGSGVWARAFQVWAFAAS